ncbi:MAG: HEAT repeat domain-containing protein, partial [Gemmatimonadota bacterium]
MSKSSGGGEDVLQQLRDRDAVVRRDAARSLGAAKRKEYVKDLSLVLVEDPSAPVRRAAAEALGLIGDKTAKAVLERAGAYDEDIGVKKAAVGALTRLGFKSGEMPGILPTSRE